MMKRILFWLGIALLGWVASCSDDNEEELGLSSTEILLDANGTAQKVKVLTDNPQWRVVQNKDAWVIAKRDSGRLVIGALPNQTKSERTARVIVVSGKTPGFLMVTQKASTRTIGEPYPDVEHPIGVIYKVTDGGEHGMILSLDMFEGAWSHVVTVNKDAQEDEDGRINTEVMIRTRKDEPDFATNYPAFHWIYQEKNQGKIDGDWYIPAYDELLELYLVVTGSQKVGVHNITARNRFDQQVKDAGGVPFDYEGEDYMNLWSSTENNGDQAYWVLFRNGQTSTPFTIKNRANWVRAVRAF